MYGNGMYGKSPSSLTGLMPSDSEVFSTLFNPNSSSSAAFSVTSKPKILPPPPHWVSPPLVTADFFRSEDPNQFALLRNHSGSDYPFKFGKPVASSDAVVDSSSSFDFSDPYYFVPVHLKVATEDEPFSAGVDSEAKTSSKEHKDFAGE